MEATTGVDEAASEGDDVVVVEGGEDPGLSEGGLADLLRGGKVGRREEEEGEERRERGGCQGECPGSRERESIVAAARERSKSQMPPFLFAFCCSIRAASRPLLLFYSLSFDFQRAFSVCLSRLDGRKGKGKLRSGGNWRGKNRKEKGFVFFSSLA